MKSYWLNATATQTSLEVRDVAVPEPGPGQILVRMHAAGLNRGEFIARRDLHGKSPVARAAGNEGAGEVVKLGPGVSQFRTGQRIMAVCGGAFSEFALMDAATAILVPDVMSWAEAACTPLVSLVVHDMLIGQGHLKASQWVLVTGVSSGVGVAAIQAARALGAHTIGTSGSQDKLTKLKALGLEVGIATRAPDFHEAVMTATAGKGANLIINAVGGTLFPECLRTLAFEGRLATVGYLDAVTESSVDLGRLHANRLVVFGVSALLRSTEQRAATVRGFSDDILPFLAQGRIKPLIDRVFEFARLPEAKAYMESNAHLGKIALKIGGD